ncbi:potassium channel subfamily K member 15-like [Pollicipes pollicipes]|uniref:potassium channel subfamily K member 15-like n=1 Tax=Pollicipes pollicipes TaxID=41117 RepID=UPI0018854D15|nr:potassium channel subfamily K member 15-like [Pollicipes pollicipes]
MRYGHIAPRTDVGKLATVAYALLGVPLTLLCLTCSGQLMANALRRTYSGDSGVCSVSTHRRAVPTALTPAEDPEKSAATCPDGPVPVLLVLALLVGYVGTGAVVFSWWEGWRFVDGVFFCFLTLSTVGFGDMTPGAGDLTMSATGAVGVGAWTLREEPRLVFCCLYLVLGLAVIAMSFGLVQDQLVARCRQLGTCVPGLSDSQDISHR